jgi:hypothetical protein
MALVFTFLTGTAGFSQSAMDLGATTATTPAGHVEGFQPATILVDGRPRNISAGSALTPAEVQGLMQVLQTGRQSLILGAGGAAVGGSVIMSPREVSSLVIPKGVTAITHFTNLTAISVVGQILNSGTLYGVSTNPVVTNAVFNAGRVENAKGGLISSLLPANGLPGFGNAISGIDLTLNSLSEVVNHGTISGAGSLNVSAANGELVNTGVLSAGAGDVNIGSGTAMTTLNVNNAGGRIEALNGAINFRDSSFAGKFDLNVTGGSLLSRTVNLNSGNGFVRMNVGEVTGVVNTIAADVHLAANSTALNLGNMQVSADPVFITTGNLNLSSIAPISGQEYIMIAGGNITGTAINTSSSTGNGGNVVLVAGANATNDGTYVTVTGRSGTGGDILLTNAGAGNIIDTSSTFVNGNGGNVTLIAYSGTQVGNAGGHVILSGNNDIVTSGNGTGSNGDVGVIAEARVSASQATSISLGDVSTAGGAGGGGKVLLLTTSPQLIGSSGLAPTFRTSDGALVSGTYLGGPVQNAAIAAGNVTTNGAPVVMVAGGTTSSVPAITVGAISTASPAGDGGHVVLSAGRVAGAVIVPGGPPAPPPPTPSNIQVNGGINTSGVGSGNSAGSVAIATPAGVSVSGNITATGASGARGGSVTVLASDGSGATFPVTLAGIDASGNSGGNVAVVNRGGDIAISSSAVTINTSATNDGGLGGAISLSAANVTVGTSGAVPAIQSAATGATGTGGSVLLSASNDAQVSGDVDVSGPTESGNLYVLAQNSADVSGVVESTNVPTIVAYTPTFDQIDAGDSVAITFTPGSTPTNFTPGGYLDIKDSSAGSAINITVDVNNDTNLIVPLVSLGSIIFTNDSSTLRLDTTSSAGIGLFGRGIMVQTNSPISQLNLPVIGALGGVNFYDGSPSASVKVGSVISAGTVNMITDAGFDFGPGLTFSASSIPLLTTGTTSSITLGDVIALGTLDLWGTTGTPGLDVKNAGSVLVVGQLKITSVSIGNIQNADFQQLTVDSSTDIVISSARAVAIASASADNLSITANGSIMQAGLPNPLEVGSLILSTSFGDIGSFQRPLALGAGNSGITINIGGAGNDNSAFVRKSTGDLSITSATAGNTLSFQTDAGNITSSIDFDAPRVRFVAEGNVDVENAGTDAIALLSSSASGSFVFTTNGSLTVSEVVAENGNIELATTSGTLELLPDARISASGGSVSIHNDAPSILIGAGSNILFQNATGAVQVYVGAVPVPSNTTPPANVVLTPGSEGKVFFGAENIQANFPGNILGVSGASSSIVFDTNGNPAGSIVLGGGVTIGVSDSAILTSLDLSDPVTVTFIKSLQNQGILAGSLKVDGGIATGGTLVLEPVNISGALTALNIPNGVTITFTNFGIGTQIGVDIDEHSTTKQVLLNGIHLFNGTVPIEANFNVSSDQLLPAIVANGKITVPGALSLESNGDMQIGGVLTAKGGVTLTTSSNADIDFTANIGSRSQSLTIDVDGSGTITQAPNTKLTASTLTISGDTGHLGVSTAPLRTAASTLNLNTGGSGEVWVSNTGRATLASGSAHSFNLTNAGALTVTGTGSANQYNLTTTGAGANIVINGVVTTTSTGVATLNSSGNINLGPSGSLEGGGFSTVQLTAKGNIGTTTNNFEIKFNDSHITARSAYLSTIFTNLESVNVTGTLQTTSQSVNVTGPVNAGAFIINNQGPVIFIGAPVTARTVVINSGNAVVLNAVTASTSLTVNAAEDINATGLLKAPKITLSTTNGSIGNPGVLSTNARTISLKATGSATLDNANTMSTRFAVLEVPGALSINSAGAITVPAGFVLPSASIDIATTSGNIATLGAPVQVGAGVPVTVNAGAGGNVYVKGGSGGVSFVGTSSSGNNFFVNSAGPINLASNAEIAAGANATLNSAGGVILDTNSKVSAETQAKFVVKGTASNITTATGACIDSPMISINSEGVVGTDGANQVNIANTHNSNPITMTVVADAAYLFSNDSVQFKGISKAASDDNFLVEANANFLSGASVSAGTVAVIGSVTQDGTNTTVRGNVMNLGLAPGGAGSASSPIRTAGLPGSNTTPVLIGSGHNYFIKHTGSVDIETINITNTINVSATGSIRLHDDAPIEVGANTIILSTGTAGGISGTLPLVAPTISLTAGKLGIGSASEKVQLDDNSTLTLVSGGGIFLGGIGDWTITSATAKSAIDIKTNLSLTVAGNVITKAPASGNTGSITFEAVNAITVNPSAQVTANGGSISMNATSATGTITIGDNAQVVTNVTTPQKGTNGQVSIFVGPATSNAPGTAPTGVTVNTQGTGQVFWGDNPAQITVATGTATVNALNQNVFFNSTATGTITLGSDSVITADPPSPSSVLRPIGFVLGAAVASASRYLAAPEEATVVPTSRGELHIERNAVVLLADDGETVSVYNLHDQHAGDVRLVDAQGETVLAPGQHVTVTASSVEKFDVVNRLAGIGHRTMQTSDAGTTRRFTSEFSIISAIKEVNEVLKPAERERLLKVAAILMQTQGSRGGYRRSDY